MLRTVKLAALNIFRGAGAFRVILRSNWRKQRLLILCYHGISLEDEHEWDPDLFMAPARFRERCQVIRRSGMPVLPLADAVAALAAGELTEPSVALTFDDGFHDFVRQAAPVLREFGYPATVYLTTYYVDFPRPIFNLIVPYMLWKARGSGSRFGADLGLGEKMTLSAATWRPIASAIVTFAAREGFSAQQKDDLASRVAQAVGLDYDAIVDSKILRLMSEAEVRDLAQSNFDFQLHTHRHRTPNDEGLFRREIRDNREKISRMTGKNPEHFCYPSGVHAEVFLPWMRAEGIRSATTCDPGLAAKDHEPLLLPRKIDTMAVTEVEFDAWLTGFEPRLRSALR